MANNGVTRSRGAIGLREVLFQSVTSMAPAGAVALSIAAGATYAGGALPLSIAGTAVLVAPVLVEVFAADDSRLLIASGLVDIRRLLRKMWLPCFYGYWPSFRVASMRSLEVFITSTLSW